MPDGKGKEKVKPESGQGTPEASPAHLSGSPGAIASEAASLQPSATQILPCQQLDEDSSLPALPDLVFPPHPKHSEAYWLDAWKVHGIIELQEKAVEKQQADTPSKRGKHGFSQEEWDGIVRDNLSAQAARIFLKQIESARGNETQHEPRNVAYIIEMHLFGQYSLYKLLRLHTPEWTDGVRMCNKACAAIAYRYWNDEEAAQEIAARDEINFDPVSTFGDLLCQKVDLFLKSNQENLENAKTQARDAWAVYHTLDYIAKIPNWETA